MKLKARSIVHGHSGAFKKRYPFQAFFFWLDCPFNFLWQFSCECFFKVVLSILLSLQDEANDRLSSD